MDRLIRGGELHLFCGIKPTTVDELVRDGRFPPPVRLAKQACGRRSGDNERWQRTLPPAGPGTSLSPNPKAKSAKTPVGGRKS